MKVLHLPTGVGGHSWGLAQSEKKLGLDSKVLVASNNWIDYPYDISLEGDKKGKFGRAWASIEAFLRYRNQFDVFHFNYGSTLIDFHNYGIYHWDLPFYQKESKIIFTFNGCDARQKYRTMERAAIAACYEEDCNSGICNDGEMDKQREKSIGIISKYAHHIFALNPDLLYFLPENSTSFLPYAIAGWHEIQHTPYSIGRAVKIIHSPTNRAVKGYRYITHALENLKKRHNIEIIIIENMPNRKALEIYKEADMVIDQLLVGWYGGFAVECMKMGKPVAAYIREEDLKFIPADMAKDLKDAIINVNPSNIENVLEKYLQNPSMLKQKSQAGLEYVHKWHDPAYVAGITKAVYEG